MGRYPKIAFFKMKMLNIKVEIPLADFKKKIMKIGFQLARKMMGPVFTDTKLLVDNRKIYVVKAQKCANLKIQKFTKIIITITFSLRIELNRLKLR